MSAEVSQVSTGRDGRPIPPEIIAAARKSFLHFGVQRATVTDIAGEAGMPRQSVYEYVSSRNDLIAAAMIQRIQEIADGLKPLVTVKHDFATAFVEISTAAILQSRADKEFKNFFTTGPAALIHEIVAGPSNEIHRVVDDLLDPILSLGTKSNLLRTDQTRDQIIDWLRIVYLSLISQDDLGESQVEAIVASFLLPSLMFSKDDRRARKR